jgi:DNA-binding NtrC family response regulator
MSESELKAKSNGHETMVSHDWPSAARPVPSGLEPVRVNLSLRSFRNEAEIQAINYALGQTGWNRKRAAKLLSISYRSLLYKIRRHNITPAADQR